MMSSAAGVWMRSRRVLGFELAAVAVDFQPVGEEPGDGLDEPHVALEERPAGAVDVQRRRTTRRDAFSGMQMASANDDRLSVGGCAARQVREQPDRLAGLVRLLR